MVSVKADAFMQGTLTFLGIAAMLPPVLLENTDLQLLISEVTECPGLDAFYFVVISTDRKLSKAPRAEQFLCDRNISLCFICDVIISVKSEIPACRGFLQNLSKTDFGDCFSSKHRRTADYHLAWSDLSKKKANNQHVP